MLMLHRARSATIDWLLMICTQSLLPTNASGSPWAKSQGLGFRFCSRPAKIFRVLRPACSEPGYNPAQPTTRRSFTFDPEDDFLLVPVRIGAKEYPFVLDTGCTVSVFDASFRPCLGQRIGTETMHDAAGKSMTIDLYSAPDARVGSLPMEKHPIACLDLTKMREAAGRDIYGFLGMDFLKDRIIAIDFDKGCLDFLPPGTVKQPSWGESISFPLPGHD